MYFINEEIKPRLPELKQFTSSCHPKIASMPRHQAGHVWPGHGMAWQAAWQNWAGGQAAQTARKSLAS